MLRFEKLTKRYNGAPVFPPLTQRFGAGCVALMGDNGTGKSTLISILSGTLDVDDGDVWINGHSWRLDPVQARACVAYVPDDCLAYPQLTGRALLEQVTASRETPPSPASPAPRVTSAVDDEALALAMRLGASGHLDHRFEQMSLGTRKKMYLSAMLIGSPGIILADEPSNGLDAPAVRVLAECFRTLAQKRVVFFSTHDPRFAAACDARVIGFDDLLA